jgi:hypothetical protein
MAFYMIGGQPFPVTVENGFDAFDIDIVLFDPNGPPPSTTSAWRWREPTASREQQLLKALAARVMRLSEDVNRQQSVNR